MSSIEKAFLQAILNANKKKTTAYDTMAEVVRVEGNTAWVHINGGVTETPAEMTISCKKGDIVRVRVANGSAYLIGNNTAPPTDDETAIRATSIANTAHQTAIIADEKAEAAQPAYTDYAIYYLLSIAQPDTPTESTYISEGWSTTQPPWSEDDQRHMWYSVRTEEVSGAITWTVPEELTSYVNISLLKNAILLEVGTGSIPITGDILDADEEQILDSNNDPILGIEDGGNIMDVYSKILQTATEILMQVSQTYVGKGSSGVSTLSSTMLQNINGVNIYNGTLTAGNSYAHIDGDSFDIKQTVGNAIDDTNDKVVATFGTNTQIGEDDRYVKIDSSGVKIGEKYIDEGITYSYEWNFSDHIFCSYAPVVDAITAVMTPYEFYVVDEVYACETHLRSNNIELQDYDNSRSTEITPGYMTCTQDVTCRQVIQTSDANLKDVQGEIPDVSDVRAVSFKWKDDEDGQLHVGYIAQEVEKVAPDMVQEKEDGTKTLNYIEFLCAKIEMLERRIKELEDKHGKD